MTLLALALNVNPCICCVCNKRLSPGTHLSLSREKQQKGLLAQFIKWLQLQAGPVQPTAMPAQVPESGQEGPHPCLPRASPRPPSSFGCCPMCQGYSYSQCPALSSQHSSSSLRNQSAISLCALSTESLP